MATQSSGLTQLTTWQVAGAITRAGMVRDWRVTGGPEINIATEALHPKIKALLSCHKV